MSKTQQNTDICDVADDFGDLKGNSLTFRDDALHRSGTYDVTKRRLRTFDKSLAQVRNTERSAVRVGDLEVDDRVAIRDISVDRSLGRNALRAHISTLTLSRVMTICLPIELIWIFTSTIRNDSVHTLTLAKPGSTAL